MTRRSSPIAVVLLAALASTLFAATALGAAPRVAAGTELLLPAATDGNSVAIGPEGLPWYGSSGPAWPVGPEPPVEAIYHVTASGELAAVPLPAEAAHSWGTIRVTWGPEGTLWFSRRAVVLTIGLIGENGTVSEFPVPAGDEEDVGDLTVGPEGDAWFTLPTTGQVGRMTPTGTLTEYAVGPRSMPKGIAASGGSIWFTEEHAGRIGRIDTTGTLSAYPLGHAVHPHDIVASGGDIWFSEDGQARRRHGHIEHLDRLGRLDALGRLDQIRIPFGVETRALFADPRGSIWFSTANGELSSISTTTQGLGARRCLPPGCNFPPQAIAVAPDGTLWWAAGSQQCAHCGGGSGLVSVQQPGKLGSTAPSQFAGATQG